MIDPHLFIIILHCAIIPSFSIQDLPLFLPSRAVDNIFTLLSGAFSLKKYRGEIDRIFFFLRSNRPNLKRR